MSTLGGNSNTLQYIMNRSGKVKISYHTYGQRKQGKHFDLKVSEPGKSHPSRAGNVQSVITCIQSGLTILTVLPP